MRKRYQKFVHGRGNSGGRRGAYHPARYRFTIIFVIVLLSSATALFIRQGVLNAHSASHQSAGARAQGTCQQQTYRYYTLKQPGGFVLARAAGGSSGQPLGAPQPLVNFSNDFGQLESDAVVSMQLSPDGCYLAIDGASDHGEQVWVFDTRRMSLTPVPANVSGNFLNWLPASSANGNNGHTFLYRPMLPLGPGAPLVNGAWNPGLWMVDAATGQFRNIDIHMSSAFLVDAESSPDGTRIIYSTSYGLGMGSDIWMMSGDGSRQAHLFRLPGGAQSIAGLFAWSPDGSMIAYERLSDSPVPFQPAGLWVMNSSGTASRRLADTDGGHGFAPAWSLDSSYIAYIARTNNSNRAADYNAQSLQCAVAVANIASGSSSIVAAPTLTGAQINDNPQWIANGGGSMSITFTAYNPFNLVLGGSLRYWSAQVVRESGLKAQEAQFQVMPLSPALSHVVAIQE